MRFLFCINAGRSGSGYLARLLGADARTAAFHEAAPTMTGPMLRLAERQPYPETYHLRRHKADACRALLAAQPGRTLYAETSHMFIKTFFDVAVKELEDVGVVILRRELARVVKSFAELGIYTASNTVWPDWMPTVEARTRALDPASPEASLPPLARITAYLCDIEARAQRFRRDYPSVPVFETRLELLGSDPREIARLFAWTGGQAGPAALALAGERVNVRERRKADIGAAVSLEECADAVADYLDRCRRVGIAVPDTLALAPMPSADAP